MKSETYVTTVRQRVWEPGDTYEVVEVQVFGFPKGTPVKVTIEPITQEEHNPPRSETEETLPL